MCSSLPGTGAAYSIETFSIPCSASSGSPLSLIWLSCSCAAFSLLWYARHYAGNSWASGDLSEHIFSTLDVFWSAVLLNIVSLCLRVAISISDKWIVYYYCNNFLFVSRWFVMFFTSQTLALCCWALILRYPCNPIGILSSMMSCLCRNKPALVIIALSIFVTFGSYN